MHGIVPAKSPTTLSNAVLYVYVHNLSVIDRYAERTLLGFTVVSSVATQSAATYSRIDFTTLDMLIKNLKLYLARDSKRR